MQRLNRSTHAPVGTAFFLFLALAILPVSLRVVGVQISFSPRLSAAMDAWQQITEVFGASYQLGTNAGLAAVKDPEAIPSKPLDSCVAPLRRLACAREIDAPNRTNEITEAPVPKQPAARRTVPRVAPRPSLTAKGVASFVVAGPGMKFRAIEALDTLKLNSDARAELVKHREELVRSFEGQISEGAESLAPIVEFKKLPTSNSLRMLVRIKRPAVVSPTKMAERKGFSAMALERRRQCDRAVLTSMPVAYPDNSEF